jgi:hypothetical protein
MIVDDFVFEFLKGSQLVSLAWSFVDSKAFETRIG